MQVFALHTHDDREAAEKSRGQQVQVCDLLYHICDLLLQMLPVVSGEISKVYQQTRLYHGGHLREQFLCQRHVGGAFAHVEPVASSRFGWCVLFLATFGSSVDNGGCGRAGVLFLLAHVHNRFEICHVFGAHSALLLVAHGYRHTGRVLHSQDLFVGVRDGRGYGVLVCTQRFGGA